MSIGFLKKFSALFLVDILESFLRNSLPKQIGFLYNENAK